MTAYIFMYPNGIYDQRDFDTDLQAYQFAVNECRPDGMAVYKHLTMAEAMREDPELIWGKRFNANPHAFPHSKEDEQC